MFNKSILMGRICNNLELKTTPNGISVLTFRIAVERSYQAKGEERVTDFFNILAWRWNAEFIAKYFSKGRMILIEGELQTRQYVDKNGVTQYVVELVANSVHFTGEPKAATAGETQTVPPPPAPTAASAGNAAPAVSTGSVSDFAEATDDDYPF